MIFDWVLSVFSLVLVLLALYYGGMMGLFAWGFRRVLRTSEASSMDSDGALPFVSVVVAARDEAASIEACLTSVLEADYPEDRFEVVVVDDFSEDETAAIVRRMRRRLRISEVPAGVDEADNERPERLRLVRMRDRADSLPRTECGVPAGHKGHALACGIAAARSELLLTTDADCRVGPGWVRAMAGAFGPDVAFVSGPVLYPPGRSPFGDLQALEFLGLIAVGAGAIGAGRPNLCNSANVAYRRAAYDRLRPDPDVGPLRPNEDEVLLQTIAAETGWKVAFCASPQAKVEAEPVTDVRAFLAQRQRWAASGARYPSPALVASIAGVWLFYALLLGGLVAAPFVPALWPAVLGALGVKVVSEALLLVPACRHFGRAGLLRYFLPEQLLQIPYVVFIGAAGVFGSVHWKGRQVSS